MPQWMTPFSWLAAAVTGALVGGLFMYLFWPPNYGELTIGIGSGISVMVVLRRVIISELEKRHESA